jgi:alpha-tubulin suppressor-like RCC1 family protein
MQCELLTVPMQSILILCILHTNAVQTNGSMSGLSGLSHSTCTALVVSGMWNSIPHESNETPTLVSRLTDAVAIEAGTHHNIALRSNGEVVVWGHAGKYGRLGILEETTNDGRYVVLPLL